MGLIAKLKAWTYKRVISPEVFAARERAFWKNRRSDGTASPFLDYWNDREKSPNRQALTTLVIDEIRRCQGTSAPSVLEFGAFCGPNLEIIGRKLARDVDLYAVEPNGEACAFIRSHLASVKVLEMDDVGFCHLPRFDSRIDVVFANAVFYVMPEDSVRRVLEKASQMTDTVVIGDEMKNVGGTSSHLDRTTLSFQHPYRTILKDLGFTDFHELPAPEPVRALDGFLVARRANSP